MHSQVVPSHSESLIRRVRHGFAHNHPQKSTKGKGDEDIVSVCLKLRHSSFTID